MAHRRELLELKDRGGPATGCLFLFPWRQRQPKRAKSFLTEAVCNAVAGGTQTVREYLEVNGNSR